jgi:hypothetical protein
MPKQHPKIMDRLKLFSTGFIQVFFVAVNTYFISRQFFLGVFICGFIISLIWSWNVKKIAFGTFKDRLSYALGAGFGSLMGLVASHFII